MKLDPREAGAARATTSFERTHRARARRRSRTPAFEPTQIDEVVLVGGMTRMPKVVEIAREASSARSRTRA